jgi:hypothetical protein
MELLLATVAVLTIVHLVLAIERQLEERRERHRRR